MLFGKDKTSRVVFESPFRILLRFDGLMMINVATNTSWISGKVVVLL